MSVYSYSFSVTFVLSGTSAEPLSKNHLSLYNYYSENRKLLQSYLFFIVLNMKLRSHIPVLIVIYTYFSLKTRKSQLK